MTSARPSVLFLLVDCLRADALDGSRAPTPTLDALANRGVRFTQAIASASSTTPCMATILSGLYSPRHGVRAIGGHRLRPEVETLPERLAAAGYHTVAEVTGPLLAETGLGRGFASYQVRPVSAYLSDAWGRALITRVREELPSPWFLFVHLWELHSPRKVLPSQRRQKVGRTRYDRALASLDATLPKLLDALPADTVVVVHGDHGERLVESVLAYRWYRLWRDVLGAGRTRKREGHETDIYEPLIRVPLVLVAEGRLPAGARVDQLVRQADITPTLLDLLALPPITGVDGTSLLPAMAGHDLGLEAFVEAFGRLRGTPRDQRRGWRTNRWKYIMAPNAADVAEELYDLTVDPQERTNLAVREPVRVAAMRARVAAVEASAAPPAELDAAERAAVETRLRDIGYLE